MKAQPITPSGKTAKISLEWQEQVLHWVAWMQFLSFALFMWLAPVTVIVAFRTGAYLQWLFCAAGSAGLALFIGYSSKPLLDHLERKLYKQPVR